MPIHFGVEQMLFTNALTCWSFPTIERHQLMHHGQFPSCWLYMFNAAKMMACSDCLAFPFTANRENSVGCFLREASVVGAAVASSMVSWFVCVCVLVVCACTCYSHRVRFSEAPKHTDSTYVDLLQSYYEARSQEPFHHHVPTTYVRIRILFRFSVVQRFGGLNK